MCGILGWVGSVPADARQQFEGALDALAHRGPDDCGVLASAGAFLGHRRLSIIDLSAAGHQPMVDPDTGAVIVFNGEIYNYVELRAELEARGQRFRTRTDTEVLLRALLVWGPSALGRLNGMWAFGLWQPAERTLLLARDRFGVKPLYIARQRGALAFGSEAKALVSLLPEHRAVDLQTLYDFLAAGRLYASGGSFYRGIELVQPAHYAIYRPDRDEYVTHRYWEYPAIDDRPREAAREAEEFAALFDNAVRLRLRSDVPVGVSLSGGLDSTAALASSMAGGRSERVCFTSVYGRRGGERDWAKLAAAPYGLVPVEVDAPQSDWLETLARIAWHLDGPGYSPAVYPQWQLMAEARRRGVPVVLEGQGADEALAGYVQYGATQLHDTLSRAVRSPRPATLSHSARAARQLAATFGPRWLALWMIRQSLPGLIDWRRRHSGAASTLRRDVFDGMTPRPSVGSAPQPSDRLTAQLWADHSREILPGLLHYGDAMSMAHGIESRQPFLDYRLVEWLFARPADLKIRDGETKWLLRQYLRGAGQRAIGDRRDKQGYPTPVDAWLAADDGAIPREWLTSASSRIRDFCDPTAIERLIRLHRAGVAGVGNHLYRLLSTEFWLRTSLAPSGAVARGVAA